MYNRNNNFNNNNNGFQKTQNNRRGYGNQFYNTYDDSKIFNKTFKKPIRRHKKDLIISKLGKRFLKDDSKVDYLKNLKNIDIDSKRLLAKDSTEILDQIVYPKNFQLVQEKRLNDYLQATTVLNTEKTKFLKNFIAKEFPSILQVNPKVNKNWKASFSEDKLLIHKLYERCNTKQHCGINLKPFISSTNLHDTIYISLDLEEYENSSKITEVGITIYDPRENGFYDNNNNGFYHKSIDPFFRTYHIIVKERITQRNKRFIFCKKQESLFNETYILDFKNTHSFLQLIWDRYFNNEVLAANGFKVALVGQSVMGDISSLKKEFNLKENFEFDSQLTNSINVQRKQQNANKRVKVRKPIVNVYDTEKLSRIVLSDSISVKKQLRFLNIPHTALHNALNDSYYTLLSFIKMTNIDSRINMKLDDPMQIFQRWSHLQLLNENTSTVIPLEIAYLLEKEEKLAAFEENGGVKEEESKSVKKLNKLTQQLEFGLPLDVDTYLDIPF